MTVINNNARNQYVATPSQTIFNYTFEIAANTDILVYQRAAADAPNDTTDKLVLTTDYTVTGVGVNTGGTIVLNSGATTGDFITIQGNAPAVRSTSFTPNGVIAAQNLNIEFDNDILIYQTLLATQNYLIPKYPKSAYVQSFELILPNLGDNQVWQMNAAGTAIIASTMVSGEDFASHAAGLGASLIGLHPTGTVQDLANAPFILKTANPAAPNAQALGALASGVMKNTTTSGVVSISTSLTSLDSLTIAADVLPYGSAANTYSLTPFTAFARTLLDDTTAIAARATLGVTIGTQVQAYNDNLQSISSLGTAADKMIYTTGVAAWAETALTGYSRSLFANASLAAWQTQLGIPGGGATFFLVANNLSEGVPATMRTNLGLVIGANVQAYDATLQSLSALGTAADRYAYTTGVDTWAEGVITALGRSLLDDVNQAAMNVTIGSLPLAGGTMTGDLFLNGSPTVGSQAATKSYVDSIVQNDQLACNYATTANLAGYTYLNGTLGVGATLTAGSNGAFTTDGSSPALNDRIMVLFQSAPAQNGAYTLSTVGTAGTPAILTRATDWDVAGEMQAGDVFAVVSGTTYGASQWMFSQTAAITVGTTALTFTQLAGQGALLKANNLSDLPSAATARVNLGLVIGANVQAYDATLQSISSLGTAANKMIYTTGVDTWAETDVSAFGRTWINLADAAAGRTALALGTMATQAASAVAITGGTITGVATETDKQAQGRLTLTTAVPVTTSNVTAATTLYYTPYMGNFIDLYNGTTQWDRVTFAEISIAVPATTNTMYDVYVYNNAGTATLELTAWTNDTTRATALVRQDGIYVKTGALTRRYVGSFRTTGSSGQTEDSLTKRYVWNYYNRVLRNMIKTDTTDTWNYSSLTFQQANASAANQLDMVIGVSEDSVNVQVLGIVLNSGVLQRSTQVSVGLDGITSAATLTNYGYCSSTFVGNPSAIYSSIIAAGRHYLTWLEAGAGSDTQTWLGDGGSSVQSGIYGTIRG